MPLIFNEPFHREDAAREAGDVRNFDVFEFTCNATHELKAELVRQARSNPAELAAT